MANPTQRRPKSHRLQRNNQKKLTVAQLSECPKCKKPRRPHRACVSCGTYKKAR